MKECDEARDQLKQGGNIDRAKVHADLAKVNADLALVEAIEALNRRLGDLTYMLRQKF